MLKTRRSMGRSNAVFYLISVTPFTEQPGEFHIGGELTAKQRHDFRTLLYDDLPYPPHIRHDKVTHLPDPRLCGVSEAYGLSACNYT
jgi:hypothetical protein